MKAKLPAKPISPRGRRGWLWRLVADTFYVVRNEKKWWLLPLLIMLLLLAALLVTATLAGPLAPFLYPLL